MKRLKRIIIRSLNRLYRNRWIKIAIPLAIIMNIVVVLLGVLLLNNSKNALRNSVLSNHKAIITRAASEINLLFRQSEELLNTTATLLSAIYSEPWRQETVLVGLVLNQPIFSRVALLDLSAKVLASSELGESVSWNYAKDAIAKVLRGQKIYVSTVRFQDNNYTPYLTMAVPVKVKGKTDSVLIADVNLRGLWDIVDKIRLDNTGRAFLVANDGMLLASADKKQVLKNENLKSQIDVRQVLLGETASIELQDEQGKKWVSSYAPISDIGWGVVLRQEQNEAYLFSRIMNLQSWIIIILSELIAILIAIVMARVFARPIKNLVARIKSAPEGLESKIDIIRHDEIGELIKVFNKLTDKLKKAKASARFSSIGEAAVWVAHELKNSLAPIKSFIQLLPAKYTDGKFMDRFSNVIPEEINRCERMLKELSDFSSHSELNIDKINLKDIMDSVLGIMEDKFFEKGIKVRFHIENNGFYIWGDAERVKQVFINLIFNAINALPKGGALTISMALVNAVEINSFSCAEIKISDTGIGIPQERLKNIFEPFKTTQKDGMGLGLAISRKIIKQHNGDIRVESHVGEGTTFTVTFPTEQLLSSKPQVELE